MGTCKTPLRNQSQPSSKTHRWCRMCGGLVPRFPKRHKHKKQQRRKKALKLHR